MFERSHHRKIAVLLEKLDTYILSQTGCYFAGGTAISLLLGEYRESLDIDFLCADDDGFRTLRNITSEAGLGPLLKGTPKYLRETRSDRYAVRSVVDIDGTPIKIEFVKEGNLKALAGGDDTICGLQVLNREDLFATKLLANVDRWNDRSVGSRDILDLCAMAHRWGAIPQASFAKARTAYGAVVDTALVKAATRLGEGEHLINAMRDLKITDAWTAPLLAALSSLARPQ